MLTLSNNNTELLAMATLEQEKEHQTDVPTLNTAIQTIA